MSDRALTKISPPRPTRPSRLTKKAEPPPTRDVNRDSGTASANGGWLRRLVRPQKRHKSMGTRVAIRINPERIIKRIVQACPIWVFTLCSWLATSRCSASRTKQNARKEQAAEYKFRKCL